MLKIFDDTEPPKGSLHKLVITNMETGRISIELDNIEGGIFIAKCKDDPSPIGSSQAAFGTTAAILISALKIKSVIKRMIELRPELREDLTTITELAKKIGMETTDFNL